jgi:sec-independent protein translocase protein TatA
MFEGLFQPTHLVIILLIALLIFGPKRLPEFGKNIGEGVRSFNRAIKGDSDPPSKPNNSDRPSGGRFHFHVAKAVQNQIRQVPDCRQP